MLEGSCLCIGIRFTITGRRSLISICHCSLCRKTTGGGGAAEITVDAQGFTWITGRDLVGDGPKHTFCRTCGAHIPYAIAGGKQINVPVGSLDGNPTIAVGRHIYVGSKAHWETIGPGGSLQYAENGRLLPVDEQA